jgi:NADH-quinone oxidoreductase subunit M
MNYIVIGIFSLDAKAIFGAIIYMMAHGIVSTGLFFLIGVIYENTGTRDLLNLSSLKYYNSKLIVFFFLFNLANISFPLSISFLAELVILNNLAGFNLFVLFILIFSLFFAVIYTF